MCWKSLLAAALSVPFSAHAAYAYIGPGGAVSAIGALLGLVVAVIAAVFGFFWFPLKRALHRRRTRRAEDSDNSPSPEPPCNQAEKQ